MLPAAETVSRPAGEPHAANASRDVAISFLRLANLDNDIVDRAQPL